MYNGAVFETMDMAHWTETLFVEHPEVFLPDLEERVEQADEQVAAMLSLLDEAYGRSPTSVLDVACGIGRHVIPFAERGLAAHGLDVTTEYIERAAERAADAGVADTTSFYRRDMRELDALSQEYELLVNVYTSFGFFDEATNEALLEAFYNRLDSGGTLLLELANKEGLLAAFDEDGVTTNDERTYVERREYDPATSRIRTALLVIANETYHGQYEFDLRVYAPVELQRLLDGVGFNDVRMYSSFDGEELTRKSKRMVVLGRK